MLTKIVIRNFKRFEKVEIPLGNGFVFIGPNNSGKTSALQALTLWHACLQKWISKRVRNDDDLVKIPAKRSGVTVNRKDLVFLPTIHSNSLWRNREVIVPRTNARKLIELTVHGTEGNEEWRCGLELDYTNEESFHCRPLRIDNDGKTRMPIPPQATKINVVLLPPMSGLTDEEALIQSGRINHLLGQGKTAEVLRNICYALSEKNDDDWDGFRKHIRDLFGVRPEIPMFNSAIGAIEMNYEEKGTLFDLQSVGRGTQQVMLILAFLLYHDPGTVLLLDEPDAHLEILRQEAIYRLLKNIAHERESQIIVASHSEKLLNDAAQDGTVAVFVGKKPRLLGEGKKEEVRKSLNAVGWDVYYQAELKKWVLYLEGNTDKSVLAAFAQRFNHPAAEVLADCYCRYLGTDAPGAQFGEFSALKLAVPELTGLILTDKEPRGEAPGGLRMESWKRREIENYLCTEKTLMRYAEAQSTRKSTQTQDMFGAKYFCDKMREQIGETERALKQLNLSGLFSADTKASEKLATLLKQFADSAGVPGLAKRDLYTLVQFIPTDEIDSEIREKLDAIYEIAQSAKKR